MRTMILTAMAALALSGPSPAEAVRVMFVGDIMLDDSAGQILRSGGDPFAGVASVLRDADLAVGNLECVIALAGSPANKNYRFRAPLSALPVLKKYFSAVALANNHTGDWGMDGFVEQLERLENASLPYFGGGRNARAARGPLVLESKGRRIAFLGYNNYPPAEFAASRSAPGVAWLKPDDVIADLVKARRVADYVLLFLHWGKEGEDKPLPEQQDQARRFIEAGADAVIGGHPHVTQTVEWYRKRPIIYSLGNFVFDYHQKSPPAWTGWMARVALGGGNGVELDIIPVEADPEGLPRLKR